MKIQILNMNPSFDHTGIVKHKTDLDVVKVDEVIALPSGKGVDVARVLKALGYSDYLVSNIIGGKIGRLIEESIQEEGINCWNYKVSGESRINYAYVDEVKGRIFMINEQGPVISLAEKEQYFYELNEWLIKDQLLVISGSAPKGFIAEDIQRVIKMGKAKNMFIAVDTSKEWLVACIKEGHDLLKINNEEFSEIYKPLYPYRFEVKEDYIRVIEKEGFQRAVITFGKKGALAYEKGDIIFGEITKIFSEYAVGSGDAFFAGYLYGYVNQYDLKDSLKLAMACGVANTMLYGAGLTKYEDIMMIKDNYIKINR
jgi:1-phosphofructokinase